MTHVYMYMYSFTRSSDRLLYHKCVLVMAISRTGSPALRTGIGIALFLKQVCCISKRMRECSLSVALWLPLYMHSI